MPKISIIIPLYNAEKHIGKCVQSVLDQTYKDFEMIIVDDGSTDNGAKIVEKYAKQDSRIRLVCKENGGVSSARNRGLEEAEGELVTFCDSDDYYTPSHLEILINHIEGDAEIDLSVSNFMRDKNNNLIDDIKITPGLFKGSQLVYDLIYSKNNSVILGSTCNKLFKSSIIRQNGIKFDQTLKFAEALNPL